MEMVDLLSQLYERYSSCRSQWVNWFELNQITSKLLFLENDHNNNEQKRQRKFSHDELCFKFKASK